METLEELLNRPILEIGDWTFSLAVVVHALIIAIATFAVSRVLSHLLRRGLRRSGVDTGVENAIATIAYYLLLLTGFSFLLSELGIGTANIAVFAGAIGLGVGIGLQDIAKNFISGLILLIARPVKPGDRIITDDLEADVRTIGAYFTSVQTLDDATVIIPNYELLNSPLVNWTYLDTQRRFRIPIGVHYQSDPEHVRDVLLAVAHENALVSQDPPPSVLFREFADSSLNFELVVWTKTMAHRPLQMVSDLNFAIFKALKGAAVEIPYPQMDVHLRSAVSVGISEPSA